LFTASDKPAAAAFEHFSDRGNHNLLSGHSLKSTFKGPIKQRLSSKSCTCYSANDCLLWCRFFKRYNKVLLDKAAIDQEKARLEAENADLRQLLKGFLDGISVNADVLNTPANPLLVVNNRLQLMMAERKKARGRGAADGTAARRSQSTKGGAGQAAQQQPVLVLHAVSAV
jgi:hypothetical protein